jgi:tRNA (guanine-N7-)-methyltransferase
MTPHQADLLETLLPEVQIGVRGEGQGAGTVSFPGSCPLSPDPSLWLEIGFGGGEHLAMLATKHPDVTIIGCEPYWNGVASLLSRIEQGNLTNVRIFPDDVRMLLSAMPDAVLERAYILFPDPWPKTRHHKRRLVQAPLLDLLARTLKPGAPLLFATDDGDYACWMLEHLTAHPDFAWCPESPAECDRPPEEWVQTRYEEKALAAGRRPTYLRAVRK